MDTVVEIIRRWQDPGTWKTIARLSSDEETLREHSTELGRDARFWLDRGNATESAKMRMQSKHHQDCAGTVREQRNELIHQFLQIENWIREHRPELLEFVPPATFDGDPSEAIRDLKRLEAGLMKPATPQTPPGHAGHFKNNSGPPDAVQEVNRMIHLKRWQNKPPIEVCRAYIKAKFANLSVDMIETQAQSLKRKRNRY